MMERTDRRWSAVLAMVVLTAALGLLLGNTTVFLTTIVGLTFVAYGYLLGPPSLDVSVDREVADPAPSPGDEVRIELTVTNDGAGNLPDVRVFDDPPESLRVVDGAPVAATSLGPGETETVSYGVRVDRGDHAFGDPVVVTRNASGRIERRIETSTAAEISVVTDLDRLPLTGQTVGYAGRVATDEGGEGIEFYSVREYQHGDPMSRVDWNRYARDGQLRTVEFRKHRAASVVVVVDARESSAVARRGGDPDAAELGRIAAEHVVGTLLDSNNLVGVALLEEDGGYVEPATGPDQYRRVQLLLEGEYERLRNSPGFVWDWQFVRGTFRHRVDHLEHRAPDDSQIVLVSPVLDDATVSVVRHLRARGHAVTIVSPDVTTTDSLGGTIERIDRAQRLAEIRGTGTRIVDWEVDEPLNASVRRARLGWSG